MLPLSIFVGVFILVFLAIGYAQHDKISVMVGVAIFVLFAAGMLLLNMETLLPYSQLLSRH